MISKILHVGITVKDMDTAVEFYRDTLGLTYKGEVILEGPAAEKLFNIPGVKAIVTYLTGNQTLICPPVELIQFLKPSIDREEGSLFRTSISEICFETEDVWMEYDRLRKRGVEFLSPPQEFDLTKAGFGKSIAVYFRDQDGLIMELMETL